MAAAVAVIAAVVTAAMTETTGTEAVVYIAMGPVASEAIFPHSYATLRGAGAWRGDVYVVTDRPDCAPAGARIVRVPSALNASMGAVNYYKSLKMQLLALLPRNVSVVCYLDADILIGAPLAPLLAESARLQRRGSNESMLMFKEGHAPDMPFHGGVLVLARGRSERCLAAWLARLARRDQEAKGRPVRDQRAFGEVTRLGLCRVGTLPRALRGRVSPAAIERGGEWSIVNHITRTGRMQGAGGIGARHIAAVGEQLLGLSAEAAAAGRWLSVGSELCNGGGADADAIMRRARDKMLASAAAPPARRSPAARGSFFSRLWHSVRPRALLAGGAGAGAMLLLLVGTLRMVPVWQRSAGAIRPMTGLMARNDDDDYDGR